MQRPSDDTPNTRARDIVLLLAGITLVVWGNYPVVRSIPRDGTTGALLAVGFALGTAVQGPLVFTERGRHFVRWSRDRWLLVVAVALPLAAALWWLLTAAFEPPWPAVLVLGFGYLFAMLAVGIAELAWFRQRAAAD